ncbi:hypothetical protein EYE40_15130 [Glaciihabitans arcticus]|uniref:Uncharacterized protein n=1 Tax=Glaciihabitans arcticus TaxID=2668039 RepID=A0A4Q9GM64_9MICO|nr:hypothetical protein [Glaciihabitans arcticus]TBN55529.1 hypothetical protein EYE40_15130 [Glaciihabitans arcticus]
MAEALLFERHDVMKNGSPMKLAETSGEFSWGVLLIEDEGSTEEIPPWPSPDEIATFASSSVVLRILHGQEGPTSVRIWDSDVETRGELVFEREIEITSGTVLARDAVSDVQVSAALQPGTYVCRIFVDSPIEASEVDISLSHSA